MNVSGLLLLAQLMIFPFFSSAQKKQPVVLQWKIAGELSANSGGLKPLGLAGAVIGVTNDILIIGGGSNFPDSMPWLGGKKKYYNEMYVFKRTNDGLLQNYKSFRLPFPLAYSANCSTRKGIVAAGGENENGLTSKVLLIQWASAAQNIVLKNLPDLPFSVTNATVAAHGNKIYLAGGETNTGASKIFLSLDLDNTETGWKALPPLPKALSHAVMLIQSDGHNKCLYVFGGRKKSKESLSDFYASVYRFSLKTNEWCEKQSLPYGLSAGTGVAAGRNYVLLFGGDRGETFHKTEAVLLALANEKNEEKKTQLNQIRTALQSSHPGFSKEVLLYNTKADVWTVCGSIPFDVPATTTAVQWGKYVYIPNGEIRAGVRTPQILVAKMEMK